MVWVSDQAISHRLSRVRSSIRTFSKNEISRFAREAIKGIDENLRGMDNYLESIKEDADLYNSDAFFIRHDVYLYKQEKLWLQEVIERSKIDGGLIAEPLKAGEEG